MFHITIKFLFIVNFMFINMSSEYISLLGLRDWPWFEACNDIWLIICVKFRSMIKPMLNEH